METAQAGTRISSYKREHFKFNYSLRLETRNQHPFFTFNILSKRRLFHSFIQGRPSGEAFVQLKNPDQAHKCANDLHLKHMGERYIEVFQCSVQDMTWMLATSHANQLACQHLSQLNNAKNSGSGGKTSPVNSTSPSKSSYQQSTPSPPPPPPLLQTTQAGPPPPPMNGILTSPPVPPPITTNGYFTSEVPAMPIYTGPFPHVFPAMPQQGFLPPPPMPHPQTTGVPAIPNVMPPMVSSDYSFRV